MKITTEQVGNVLKIVAEADTNPANLAISAQAGAEAAELAAQTAQAAAETAQTGAETAETGAQAAQAAAETAEANAETAQAASEAARDLSIAAKDEATAQAGAAASSATDAQTAQAASEAARDLSVIAKDAAETAAANAAAQVALCEAQVALAEQAVLDATDQVALAAAQVVLAEAQVSLAEAQVALAVAAKNAAETAQSGAETAETNAGNSATAAASSASASATSATESEAAKTAVEAILDFTDGNVYQGDGVGIAALSREDFGNQKELQTLSFLGQSFDAFNLHSWGRFQVGVTSSNNGLPYTTLGIYSTMPLTNNGAFSFNYSAQLLANATEYIGFALIKDVSNYYAIECDRMQMRFVKVISGEKQTLFSQNIGLNLIRSVRYRGEGAIQIDNSNLALNFYFFLPAYGVISFSTGVVEITASDADKVGVGSNRTTITGGTQAINYSIYN